MTTRLQYGTPAKIFHWLIVALLAVLGVLSSVVGAFYYLTIIKTMYFDEPIGAVDPVRVELRAVLAIAGTFTILFFVYPAPLVNAAAAAAKSLF